MWFTAKHMLRSLDERVRVN